MTTVGASVQVHLQLKGLVDIDKEVSLSLATIRRKITSLSFSVSLSFLFLPLSVVKVSKLEEKIRKIDSQLEKLVKQEQVDGYEEKVTNVIGAAFTS